MSVRKGLFRRRGWSVWIVLVVGLALVNPSPASAASVRLHVWDFNACDQFGRGFSGCDVTPTQRASAITQSITSSWAANVVALQEMCRSTFDMVVGSLPPGWVSSFHSTYTTTDSRCQSVDHTWGIAVLARSGLLSNTTAYPLGTETSGEQRTLLCIDVVVGVGMRTCTTHLTSTSQSTAATQANRLADRIKPWIDAGATVVLGGDFNLDVRQCRNTDVLNGLRRYYYGRFGGGTRLCYPGSGSMYEVDHVRAGGDGVYDEDTSGDRKIDYVFGNVQHMNGDYAGDATSSSASDHDPLRGELTAHD